MHIECDSSHVFVANVFMSAGSLTVVVVVVVVVLFVTNDEHDGEDLIFPNFVSSSELVFVIALAVLISELDTLGDRSLLCCCVVCCDDFSDCVSVSLSLDALDLRGRSVGPMLRTDFRKSLFVHLGLSPFGTIIFAGESPFGAGGGSDLVLSGDFCFNELLLVFVDEELFPFESLLVFSDFVADFVKPVFVTDDFDEAVDDDDDELLELSLDFIFLTDSIESLLTRLLDFVVVAVFVVDFVVAPDCDDVLVGVLVVIVADVVTYLLSKNDVHEAMRDDLNREYFDVSSNRSD